MAQRLMTLALSAVLLSPGLASADEVTIGAGINVTSSPYRSMDYAWNPIPLLAYEGEYFYLRGAKAGIKVLNTDMLEVSAFARYDPMNFDASHSNDWRMKQLHDRDASVSAGIAARLKTPWLMLMGDVGVDVLDKSRSLTAKVAVAQSWEFGGLEVIPSLGLHLYNHMYNIYYYGVTAEESRASGLKTYRPGGGIEPYVGLTMNYSVTEAVEVLTGVEWTRLSSSARNSPMVDAESTVGLTLGVLYSF